jgi:uncharacterized protein YggE
MTHDANDGRLEVTEMSSPVLSVRGEASRDVAPDSAVIQATISATQDTKADALRQVSGEWDRAAGVSLAG